MEGTSLLTKLNHFDQTLSPSDILDTTSVDRFRALLNHSDRHVKQLASKILLEHNHDVSLQTQDHRIVPLSFAVLSKFSDIFPEDSDFLLGASEPIPIPISSGSLDLVLQAWKGESLRQVLCGDNEKISKTKKLLKGISFLAAEGSISSNLIGKIIRVLAPDLDSTIPLPQHLRVQIQGDQAAAGGFEQLKHVLLFANLNDFYVTVVARFTSPHDLWYLREILENDRTYPIQALDIGYYGYSYPFETTFFDFLKRNGTLQSLEIDWYILNHTLPVDLTRSPILLEALQINRSVKTLTLRPSVSQKLDTESLAKTLQENHTLETLTVHGADIFLEQEASLLQALNKSTTLRKVELCLQKYMGYENADLSSFVKQSPMLESLTLSTVDSAANAPDISRLISAVKKAPRLKDFVIHLIDNNHFPCLREIGRLLYGNQTIRKLEFLSDDDQTTLPWTYFFEGLRNNKTLQELNFFAPIPDMANLMTELMTIVAGHPKLTRLGLPRWLTPRQTLTVCNFLRDNPPLQQLSLRDNYSLGMLGRESGGFRALLAALQHNTRLKSLDLSHCCLGTEEFLMLGEHLASNHNLKELILEGKWIYKEAIHALVNALEKNTSLVSITLPESADDRENRWPEALSSALKKNPTLRHLRLKGHLDRKALTHLRKVIRRKEYFNLETG